MAFALALAPLFAQKLNDSDVDIALVAEDLWLVADAFAKADPNKDKPKV